MRNGSRALDAIDALLAHSGDRGGPTYRFHGRTSPKSRQRTPLLGSTPSTAVVDGVAKMRLYEPIDSWGGPWGVSALEFTEVLDQLGNDVTEIRLHINSPGGEVWEALAILNQLRQHHAKVTTVVDGIAASCASFIACAADETLMSPNSQLMIHDAWGICIGNAGEMHQTGDLLDKVSSNIASIYAAKAGGSTEEWRDTMKGEARYMAEESVEAGLADEVLGSEAEDQPADRFDMKGIGARYASRDEAPPPPRVGEGAPDQAPVPDFTATAERGLRLLDRRRSA